MIHMLWNTPVLKALEGGTSELQLNSDPPLHLIELNAAISIHIVHPESPGKLFFRGAL